MIEEKRLRVLLRHIQNVRESTLLLGERLINGGEKEVGRNLIANGLQHDISKFNGAEWLYLHDDVKTKEPYLFKAALTQHQYSNSHHPEYWQISKEDPVSGIQQMPRVYRAEMVCDFKARSNEFGSSLMEWIKGPWSKKYKLTFQSKCYKEIKDLAILLLDKEFDHDT